MRSSMPNATLYPYLRSIGCGVALDTALDDAASQSGLGAHSSSGASDYESDGYETDGLESACSTGKATVEQCFGPGSDKNGNGIADSNE